ncbi:AMP-binding protein [Pseudoclavibacter sp. RFBG4]|uniref:AMP-binding protein n=1 Tax=Pseudoclavibacter sp. RFBG4 TaxID=2080575 RepID=UPI001CA5A02F|nr:AMP-binding protein [Pseudoclavibacter sp. RFBG4]
MFKSPYPDEQIPNVSVFDFLFSELSEADAARIAIVDGTTGAETTFGTLKQHIELIAGALAGGGLGIGDVVALHCPNVPAFASVFHGILRSGATATTINALYTAEEIETQLRDSGAKLLFTVSPLLQQAHAGAIAAGLEQDAIIVLDGAEGYHDLRELLGAGLPAPEVSFDPATHVAVLPYSSGTTGKPKGVMLSHTNLVANVVQTYPVLDVEDDDVVLALLPFFHIYGMTVLLDIAIKKRARLVTMPKFELGEFLRIIETHRCTYLFIAPPIAVALAKHPLIDTFDLSSVRSVFSGAAPIDAALMKAVADRIGTRTRQGYGMSEASPVTHVLPPTETGMSLGSVGVPIANTEVKLVSVETGEEIEATEDGQSEPGEIWVRGPQIMLGYLGRDDATHEAVDGDGFLHTGDIATVGPLGEFTIVDRLKELIKYKGYQVAPAELEALLLTHPDITDSAVVGALDADGQEIPKAFVVRREGSPLDEAGVEAFVAGHVAPHKKVRAVAFIDVIPKSTSGKILRKDLRGR